MTSTAWVARLWTRRDATQLVVVMFLASVGMLYRRFDDAVREVIAVPTPLLALAFLGFCVLIAWVSWRWMRHPSASTSFRRITATASIVVVLAVFMFTITVPESFSVVADRDDALDIAVHGLLTGADPWGTPTQISPDHHPSPLLGGILLALPFVVLGGSSGYQSVFWLALGLFLAWRYLGARPTAVLLLVLCCSPIFLNELIFLSDLWVNAAVILIATLWGSRALAAEEINRGALIGSGALLALGLADRFIFWPLVIPIAVLAWRARNRRHGVIWVASSAAVAALLTAVPWLIWPASLDQVLRNVSKATSPVVPFSGAILVALMVATAVVLSWRARDSVSSIVRAMAWTSFVIVAWQALQDSLGEGRLVVNGYTSVAYAAAFLVLGAVALLLPSELSRDTEGTTSGTVPSS